MPAVMILLWSLDVIAQCAVWTIALVCTTSFPELDLYKFSLAMGKPIIHLTCFAGPTVAFPKFSVFYETRKTSWHSSHCLFEFIFIGLSRVTIVFSYCPQVAKAIVYSTGHGHCSITRVFRAWEKHSWNTRVKIYTQRYMRKYTQIRKICL